MTLQFTLVGRRRRSIRRVATPLVVTLAVAMVGLGATSAPAADAKGVGPQPSGLGLGSKAALAQKTCTPNGNTSFVYVGDGPNCVNPWAAGKDNGGATAPGVTATEVKVVFYVPNEQMRAAASPAALPKNQGTKVPATPQQVVTDWDKVFQYAIEHSGTWQTWGRKPVFDFVAATGTDETTQRADALAVIAKKPFIVFDAVNRATGAPVFASTIAASKIIVVSASTDAENGAKQSPYRWAEGQDPAAAIYVTASFVGQVLSGKKARWAGDSAMTSKTRSFGVVSPAAGFDIAAFDQQLKKNRGSAPASEVHYDGLQPTKNDEVAPVLVTKLKAAGVTSVVLFTSPAMTESLMAAATTQEFRPEWIITGYLFHDWDFWSRERDQDQMAHAFGLGVLPPEIEGEGSSTGYFQWYWGDNQGNYDVNGQGDFEFLYRALHFAGPTLTAKNVEKGLFAMPARKGASDGTTNFQQGFGKTTGLPYNAYAPLGSDRNLLWWNRDLTGGANATPTLVGLGKFEYLDGGKRYSYGAFPKQPKFFDEAASVSMIPRSSTFPGGVIPPPNPCDDCPSNGGSG